LTTRAFGVSLVVLLVGCAAPAPAAVTTTPPTVAPSPSPSVDAFTVACATTWTNAQAVTDELTAMVESFVDGDLVVSGDHMTAAHRLANKALDALPPYATDARFVTLAMRLRAVSSLTAVMAWTTDEALAAARQLTDATEPFVNCVGQ
jgi:hypothetical protein